MCEPTNRKEVGLGLASVGLKLATEGDIFENILTHPKAMALGGSATKKNRVGGCLGWVFWGRLELAL